MKGIKKKLGIRFLIILMLSFTSCGKSNRTGNPDDAAAQNNRTPAEGNVTEERKEDYVYVPETFPLENVEYVNAACGTGEGLYIAVPFYDDETWTSGVEIFYLDATGTHKKLPFRFENGEACNVYVDAMGVLGDGSLIYIKREMTITDPDTWQGTSRFFLIHALAERGEELSCVDITEQLQFSGESGQSFLQFLKIDKEDHIYVSNGTKIWVFDIDGKSVFPVATDAGSWIQDMGVTKEGQIVYSGWDSTAGGRCLFVVNEINGMLTLCKENVPEVVSPNGMVPAAEKGVLINTLQGLVEYDTQSQTTMSVLNWTDSKASSDSVLAYTVLEDGNILAILQKNSTGVEGQSDCQSLLLRKTPADETAVQEKEILTLGIFEENSSLIKAVYSFNQTQETYWINMVNYSEGDDLETGITRFTNDLIAGTGPDLFELSKVDLNRLAQTGVLEELTSYLEADDTLKREDYFESVLNAYSVDGKLYTIPNSFNVLAMAGRCSYLEYSGDGYVWTLQDVLDLAENYPEKEMFGYGSKNYILLNCLRYNYGMFIDWQSGECNLNSEAFIQLLEFANRFPDQYDERQNDYSITDKILDGTLIAEEVSFSSIQDYQIWEGLFDEDFVIKGFPAAFGTGLAVRGDNLLAINAKSEYKEAAWEFVRSFLTEEYYQNEEVTGFPTLIRAYDQINESYITPEYEMDENGNETERSKGSFSIGDFSVEFRTSTKEEAERITDVIQNCDRAASDDKHLMKIVQEEAAAFFAGQKSAQETADVIQSRVQVYVNENR